MFCHSQVGRSQSRTVDSGDFSQWRQYKPQPVVPDHGGGHQLLGLIAMVISRSRGHQRHVYWFATWAPAWYITMVEGPKLHDLLPVAGPGLKPEIDNWIRHLMPCGGATAGPMRTFHKGNRHWWSGIPTLAGGKMEEWYPTISLMVANG